MVAGQSIPLNAVRTDPNQTEYKALLDWPFSAQPFYVRQVRELLQYDIPHRVTYSFGLVWIYRNPAGDAIGFGVLDVCEEYQQFTSGKNHCYIPLLAVHPAFDSAVTAAASLSI